MRDSLGGTVVLAIIVVFIVIVSGYMAFNVNYTKAFRMKNKIVDSFNKYGDCCLADSSVCAQEIREYATKIGYNPHALNCTTDGQTENIYCYSKHDKVEDSVGNDIQIHNSGEKHYYSISTKVDINILFINSALNLRFLYVSGDTNTISSNNSHC